MKRAAHARIERLEKRLPPVAANEIEPVPDPEPLTGAEVWQMVCEDARMWLQGWGGRLSIKLSAPRENRSLLEQQVAVIQAELDTGKYRPPIFLTSTEAETALAMLDAGAIKQCKDPDGGAAGDPSTWPGVGFQWYHYGFAAGDPGARRVFMSLDHYVKEDDEAGIQQWRTLGAVREAIALWDGLTRHEGFPAGDHLAVDDLRAFLQMALNDAKGFEGCELEVEA